MLAYLGMHLAFLAVGLAVEFFQLEKKLTAATGLKSSLGWVGLAIVFNGLVIQYLASQVMKARKEYKVDYPELYAVKAENKYAKEFNCYQRAHQNTLEQQPIFIPLTLLAAQRYPLIAAISAFIFSLSRIFFASGYYTFDPAKRSRGAFGYIGYGFIFGLAVVNCLLMVDINLLSLIGIQAPKLKSPKKL